MLGVPLGGRIGSDRIGATSQVAWATLAARARPAAAEAYFAFRISHFALVNYATPKKGPREKRK